MAVVLLGHPLILAVVVNEVESISTPNTHPIDYNPQILIFTALIYPLPKNPIKP